MADMSPQTPFAALNMAAQQYESMTSGSTRELARHMIPLSPPIFQSSTILDNACGTGIVAQEVLLNRFSANAPLPKITCVDVAPPMVGVARDIFRGMLSSYNSHIPSTEAGDHDRGEVVKCDIMPGEELKLPDEHFTHSFTNQGILFFKDPAKGAREIYRTLKTGGVAIVTTWASLGHVDLAREVQKSYKPESTIMPFPIAEEWYQAEHLKKTLEAAGFKDVEVSEKSVWFAKKSVEELGMWLYMMWANFAVGFSEEEKVEVGKLLRARVGKEAKKISRLVDGDLEAREEELVGLQSVALVGVGRK